MLAVTPYSLLPKRAMYKEPFLCFYLEEGEFRGRISP